MGGIAQEQGAAVAEPLQPAAAEGVDADPFQLERHVRAEHGAHPGAHPLGVRFGLGVAVPAELEIDAPDIVGLAVQQHRAAAMEGRVEPEPALGREVGLHHHVGDQEAVAEHLADEGQAQAFAHEAVGAVAGQQPVGGQIA